MAAETLRIEGFLFSRLRDAILMVLSLGDIFGLVLVWGLDEMGGGS
jgi:hypothetical protein